MSPDEDKSYNTYAAKKVKNKNEVITKISR